MASYTILPRGATIWIGILMFVNICHYSNSHSYNSSTLRVNFSIPQIILPSSVSSRSTSGFVPVATTRFPLPVASAVLIFDVASTSALPSPVAATSALPLSVAVDTSSSHVDVTVSVRTGELTSRLPQPSTTHVTNTQSPVVNRRCSLDLGFILDESGSIQQSGFNQEVQFVRDIARHLNISSRGTHISVMTFSDNAVLRISFSESSAQSFNLLDAALRQFAYSAGGTGTTNALNLARTHMFSTSYGSRLNAPKVLILLTDGHSNLGVTAVRNAAQNLQNARVNIFSIGVGSGIQRTELEAMASAPINSHVFQVSSAATLSSIVNAVRTQSCTEATCRYIECFYSSWGPWSRTCGNATRTKTLTTFLWKSKRQIGGCAGLSTESCKTTEQESQILQVCPVIESPLCREDGFGISIRHNSLNFTSVTLKNPSCIASWNVTHITLWTKFSECGTNHSETNDYVVVSNEVIMLGMATGMITRAKKKVIPFSCSYSRSNWISMTSFRPIFESVVQAHENGFGNFTLYFRMALDGSFGSYYTSYPVTVLVNDRIYFEVSMKSNGTNSGVVIEKCFATPSRNRNDLTKYSLINDRCPADNTLQLHLGAIHHKRFSFLAFNFREMNVPVIYLHCEVFLCQRTSQDTRCLTGCGTNKIRKRRGIQERDISSGISQNYLLDNGPIAQPVKNKGNERGVSSSSVPANSVIMGLVIGLLCLVLISLFVVKLIKFRKSKALMKMKTSDVGREGQDNKGLDMQSEF